MGFVKVVCDILMYIFFFVAFIGAITPGNSPNEGLALKLRLALAISVVLFFSVGLLKNKLFGNFLPFPFLW